MSVYPGKDFSTFLSDSNGRVTASTMDLSFIEIEGPRVCQETILRKLRCPPGSMDDEAWGMDLRTYLNSSLRSDDLGALAAAVRTEILKEEYVEDADVSVLLSEDNLMIVDITLTLADLESYTFAFSLGVDGAIQVILDVGDNAD